MGVQPLKVLKGITSTFRRKRVHSRFKPLSWLQVKLLKHQEDTSVKKLKIADINVNYKRPYELLHTYQELFVDEIYSFETPNQNPLIIDCGANIGMSVLFFKSIYPNATIIAYEPDPGNYNLLELNIKENGITNIEAIKAAVWIKNGTISFTAAGSEASKISSSPGEDVVHLPSIRLADVIQNKKIDFLKIDIEGVELEVLKDCAPYLNNVQNLFLEYHGKVTETEKLQNVLAILQKNFRVYLKLAADNIDHPFIEKTSKGSFDVQLNIFCYK